MLGFIILSHGSLNVYFSCLLLNHCLCECIGMCLCLIKSVWVLYSSEMQQRDLFLQKYYWKQLAECCIFIWGAARCCLTISRLPDVLALCFRCSLLFNTNTVGARIQNIQIPNVLKFSFQMVKSSVFECSVFEWC